VAITYVYFLIFAQFAFLKRLATLGIADSHLKVVMGSMAAGGILLSLLTPRVTLLPSPALRLRAALGACGSAALLTLLPLNLAASGAVSFLIGSGLGILTVTLVTYLPLWLGDGNSLLKVGLGTGIGYFICNIPPFFTASPQIQAMASAILCLAGIFCATPGDPVEPRGSSVSFLRVVACFTALVWLDSAAFFIIQKTPALKAGTWEGTAHLWANGGLHLAAAIASAWFLRRRGLLTLLALAFFALASACLLLLDPNRAVLASLFYPVGVSLYSVALVAYPSLLSPAASAAERGRRAGWIYAIAGWFGSAMGIGMGQNLGRIPPLFVLLAGVVIFAPQMLSGIRRRRMEIAATLAILAAAFLIDRAGSSVEASGDGLSPAERGRRVYISEGCISCHSQYVRPNTPDVALWGPVESLDELRREKPPLIGNRRQGPDLARVGNRRSPLWLKAHFYNPPELSHASIMPSYAYLFQDRRGDDLVAYLASRQGDVDQRRALAQNWHPWPSEAPNPNDGERLFNVHCSTCHDPQGRTRITWQASFRRLPPNLRTGPLLHFPASTDGLARIVKFGLPGTDMPGHEYLTDNQIASIAFWLTQTKSTGEKL
jgi:cytochrome c oxidase cbb3-type subunit 2